MTRNPLAEPGLLGPDAGAAFAVVLCAAWLGEAPSLATLGVAAFGADPLRLILAGAVTAMALGSAPGVILLLRPGAFEATRLWLAGSLVHRPLEALPGGQRQRAFVGMALAQEPEVLLLDKPTTFLDVAHQIDVADILLALNRERAVKVVAALGDFGGAARLAHHTVVLHEGRVAAEGLPGAVLTPAVLERVVGVEARVFREPVSWELVVLPLGPPGRRPGAATERAS